MQTILSGRRAKIAGALGLALVLAATGGQAGAQTGEAYPAIRLVYADIALGTPAGESAFVERVRTTAQSHCADHGAEITPYSRRAQPRFCEDGVRAQILQALPPALRSVYDRGRARLRDRAR